MTRLLLISNSFAYGHGYLDHCSEEIRDFLGKVREILFVPFALHDRDQYTATVRKRFSDFGYQLASLHQATHPLVAIGSASAFFVGGGNTFRLLKSLQDNNLLEPIRRKILEGTPYIGVSAGANIACPTIKTTNDMPIVYPDKPDALNLIPFNINPHYIDTDPASKHMGETRETRLREFHEENDLPVLGLREGAFVRIENHNMIHLKGLAGARLFIRGQLPSEIQSGVRLDALLSLPTEHA